MRESDAAISVQLHSLFSEFSSSTGRISEVQFLAAVAHKKIDVREIKLRSFYARFDSGDSGTIAYRDVIDFVFKTDVDDAAIGNTCEAIPADLARNGHDNEIEDLAKENKRLSKLLREARLKLLKYDIKLRRPNAQEFQQPDATNPRDISAIKFHPRTKAWPNNRRRLVLSQMLKLQLELDRQALLEGVSRRWTLHCILGAGASGTVVEATDEILERVAIKVIFSGNNGEKFSKDEIKHIRRQAMANMRIQHPSICRCYGVHASNCSTFCWKVSELIDGRNLAELNEAFDEHRAIQAGCSILEVCVTQLQIQ
jgi:hypothetical protein